MARFLALISSIEKKTFLGVNLGKETVFFPWFRDRGPGGPDLLFRFVSSIVGQVGVDQFLFYFVDNYTGWARFLFFCCCLVRIWVTF